MDRFRMIKIIKQTLSWCFKIRQVKKKIGQKYSRIEVKMCQHGVVENPENNLKQLLKGDESNGNALSNAVMQFFSYSTSKTIGRLCLTEHPR